MIGLLRSAWTAPRATPLPPRRVWRDWVLLAVIVAAAITEGILRPDLDHRVLDVIALLVAAPTVLWRRQHPLLMFAIATVIAVPTQLFWPGEVLYSSVFLVVLAYAIFRWGAGWELITGAPLLAGGLLLSWLRGDSLQDMIGGLAVVLLVALVGMGFRQRAANQAREHERIRMLERAHLARDLHDTVAHHVSAIAIRAQAGLTVAAQSPDAATESLRVIQSEAALTLAEMRAMVGVLRGDEAGSRVPTPRLDDIAQLGGVRAGGASVTVDLDVTGDEIPTPVAAAVVRIAQESVTNALRHARGVTRVDVSVAVDDDGVRLSVHNDGDAVTSPTPGFGITGMIERATLLGGTCRSAPTPGGGWAVDAVIPRAGWTP